MSELIVDFITSLDGYASAEGWPGWWGLEGPEYLTWLERKARGVPVDAGLQRELVTLRDELHLPYVFSFEEE